MVTLIVNPGSSSKKYALYQDGQRIFSVRFEHTGNGIGRTISVRGVARSEEEATEHAYQTALQECVSLAKAEGAIQSVSEITRVGIRVVAPGHRFFTHAVINDQYIHDLTVAKRVAPLHVPPVLEEITAIKKLLAHAQLIGVSDSAFHSTIPAHRTTYSLARTAERGIRRYGYHGLSVASVVRRVPEMHAEELENIIVAHIGSGVSVTALSDGKSVDTTMGYTPASGVVMGSRAGDIDPGALIALLECESLSGEAAHTYLQTQGGLFGLTNQSDLRQVLQQERNDIPAANDAVKIFLEQIQKAIANMMVTLGRVDGLILTATAMERNAELRDRLIAGLQPFGFAVSEVLNNRATLGAFSISDPDTSIPILVIPTDEMGEMERVTSGLVSH